MGWPQIVYVGLLGLNIGASLVQHGKPRTGSHSIWVTLTAAAIIVPVLYAGGFFGA